MHSGTNNREAIAILAESNTLQVQLNPSATLEETREMYKAPRRDDYRLSDNFLDSENSTVNRIEIIGPNDTSLAKLTAVASEIVRAAGYELVLNASSD